MCLEGKKLLQACSFNSKPVLKPAAAQCHAWHCRRDTALLHGLLSTKEKAGVICFCIRLEGRSRNVGKGAAQAPQQELKYQCVILLVEMKLQLSQKERCVDKSRGIKINQVLIARPQRDCRRYQQYLQMRKNGEVVSKLPLQAEKHEKSITKAFLQWLYSF